MPLQAPPAQFEPLERAGLLQLPALHWSLVHSLPSLQWLPFRHSMQVFVEELQYGVAPPQLAFDKHSTQTSLPAPPDSSQCGVAAAQPLSVPLLSSVQVWVTRNALNSLVSSGFPPLYRVAVAVTRAALPLIKCE